MLQEAMTDCWKSHEDGMFIDRKRFGFGALVLGFLLVGGARAQEPVTPPATPATAPEQQPAAPPVQQPVQQPAQPPEQQPATPPAAVPDTTAQPAPAAVPAVEPATPATTPGEPATPAAMPAETAAPAETPAATTAPVGTPAGQQPGAAPATESPAQETAAPQEAAPAKPVATPVAQAKKGAKAPYTGPTTVVELPPTPMLDPEGKQRLDPDGKPMFNPPVKQQRDKLGHPLFDAAGKPVFQTASDLGYDDKGKKIPLKKEKPPKTTAVSISRGTLTVDGMIGKAALNYDIPDLHYIYVYVPWIGTVVVSNETFPGSTAQKDAWNGNTLKVTVEDHTVEIYSDKVLLSKKPEVAYVLVDRDFRLPTRAPVMGYGPAAKAPYNWPGAKENPADAKALVKAPPVPQSLRPTKMLPPCPPGQMRTAAVLPGDTAATAPCVAIAAARQASAAPPKPAVTPEPATPPPSDPAPAAPATPPPS